MSKPKDEVGNTFRALEALRLDIQEGTLWRRIDAGGCIIALGKAAEMLRCVTLTEAECHACAGVPGGTHDGCYLA